MVFPAEPVAGCCLFFIPTTYKYCERVGPGIVTFFPCLFWRPGSGIWNHRRKRVKKPQGKGNFNVKVMNANYLAGFLRREDEKLEAFGF